MREKAIQRARQGFTMMEVLLVVGILAVVAALTAPNVIQAQKTAYATEMNAKAQQIYNAVQYNLSSLSSTGQLYKLVYPQPESGAGQSAKNLYAASAINELSGAIDRSGAYNTEAVYTTDGHDAAKEYGLYVAKDDAAIVASYLFTDEDNPVSEGVTPGDFWVEFSPSTGEVYSVFYWEPSTSRVSGDTNYANLSAIRSSRQALADIGVGYYGGKAIQEKRALNPPGGYASGQTPKPGGEPTWADLQLTIVNEEELYARITSSDLDSSDVFNNITITVRVTGVDRNDWNNLGTWERSYSADGTADDTIDYVSGADEADVILDSMRPGLAITDIFPNLVPGSNMDVLIRLAYKGTVVREVSISTNSLFESLTDKTAEISSLRHLNNLDLLRKYLAAGYTASEMANYNWNKVNFNLIDLQDDIEFDGHKWAPESVSLQSRQDFVGNGYNPLASYEPITLSPVMESQPGNYTFEGNDHVLSDFVIAKYEKDDDGNYLRDENGNFVLANAGANTGLVSQSCIKFQNIKFADPVVIGGENTGVLAGTHTAGSISNVHLYTTKGDQSFISGADNVGGLVGSLASEKVNAWIGFDNCSSTVDVRGGSYVGGLVGNGGTYSAPENCYVGYRETDGGYEAARVVSIEGSGSNAGGVFGTVSMPSKNNHALVNVSGASNVGGFAGYVTKDASIEDSTVGDPDGLYTCSVIGSEDNVGGVAGYSGATSSRCAYNTVSYVNMVSGRDNVGGFGGTAAGKHELCSVHGAVSSNGLVSETTVSGRNNVGGFVGLQSAGELTANFSSATVQRRANGSGYYYDSAECYGGFVGRGVYEKAANCYSSGSVTGGKWVGGFIGYRADGYGISNCYTTSNVKALSYAGSFAGEYAGDTGVGNLGWWPDRMRSFGKLTPLEGADTSTFGGFVGYTAHPFDPYNTTTYYLSFDGYNNYPDTASYQPAARDYQACRNSVSNAVRQSYPLSSNLLGGNCPYEGIFYSSSVLPHYGDWYAG